MEKIEASIALASYSYALEMPKIGSMASPLSSNIVGGSIVVPRGKPFGGALGGPAFPMAGTGFAWTYFEKLNRLWDNQAGTDPAEGTEGEDIARWDMIEGPAGSYVDNPTGVMLYSPGTHVINGKPTMYTRGNSLTFNAQLNDAAHATIPANGFLTARKFTVMFTARRVGTTDNVGVLQVGNNAPFSLRTEDSVAPDGIQLFGFCSGFINANVAGWADGDVKVITVRWNEATPRLEMRYNLAAWVPTGGGDNTWVPDAGTIKFMVSGSHDLASAGIYDGDYEEDTGNLDELTQAVMDWYGL